MLKASVGNKGQAVSRDQEGNKASALNKVQGGKADKPGNKAQGGKVARPGNKAQGVKVARPGNKVQGGNKARPGNKASVSNKARLGNKAQGDNKARPGNKASVSNKAQGVKVGSRVWGVNKAWGVSAVQEVKVARPDSNRGSVVNAAQFIRNNGPEEVPLQVLLFPAGFSVFPRDRRQGLHQDREVHNSQDLEYGVSTAHRVGWTSAWNQLGAGMGLGCQEPRPNARSSKKCPTTMGRTFHSTYGYRG
jgi:hypothetical protein